MALSNDHQTHQTTVSKFKELLGELKDDVVLEVNEVDNLLILIPNTTGTHHRYQSVGYVDLGDDTIHWWDDVPDRDAAR